MKSIGETVKFKQKMRKPGSEDEFIDYFVYEEIVFIMEIDDKFIYSTKSGKTYADDQVAEIEKNEEGE